MCAFVFGFLSSVNQKPTQWSKTRTSLSTHRWHNWLEVTGIEIGTNLYNTFENSLFKFMILLLILSFMIVIDCCIILSSVNHLNLLNPKRLVTREERKKGNLYYKASEIWPFRRNVRGQFDEWINIKRGRNNRVLILIMIDVLVNVHY